MERITRMFFVVFAVGLISSSVSLNINAQKAISSDSQATQSTIIEDKSLQNYIKISSLPQAQQKEFFNEVSASEKSNLWKVHFALFLSKHSGLSERQREVFFDAVSSAKPEAYETSSSSSAEVSDPKPEKIQKTQLLLINSTSVFSKPEVGKLLFRLSGETEEIEILQKYLKISDLPVSQKKQAFINSSAKEKSALWRLHIALNLVMRAGLSKEQKEFIVSNIPLITPELFEISENNPLWRKKVADPLWQMTRNVFEIFSRDAAREIFFELGNKNKKDPGENNLAPACRCYVGYADACPYTDGGTCLPVASCERKPSGCGIFYEFPCNGSGCYR